MSTDFLLVQLSSFLSKMRQLTPGRSIVFFLLLTLVTVSGILAWFVPAVADDWTQFGHDANHSGANDGQSDLSVGDAPSLGLRWSFPTGGPIVDGPAVSQGTVYF